MLWQVGTPSRTSNQSARSEPVPCDVEIHPDDQFFLWPYGLRPYLFWPPLVFSLWLWLSFGNVPFSFGYAEPALAGASSKPTMPLFVPVLVFLCMWIIMPMLVYCFRRKPVLAHVFDDLPLSSMRWMRGLAKWRTVSRELQRSTALTGLANCLFATGGLLPYSARGRDAVIWNGEHNLQGALLTLGMRDMFQSNGERPIIFDTGYLRWLFYVWLPVWNGYVTLIVLTFADYVLILGGDAEIALTQVLVELAVVWTVYACLFLYVQVQTARSWLDEDALPSAALLGIPLDLLCRIKLRRATLVNIRIELAVIAFLGTVLAILIRMLG
jgi:hypothetical protein